LLDRFGDAIHILKDLLGSFRITDFQPEILVERNYELKSVD
jgi:hypothetical protein